MRTNNDPQQWSRRQALVALLAGVGVALPALADIHPTDPTLDTWIEHALRQDPRVDATGIEITTREGIVTLRGTVADLAAQRLADREVKKLAGVRGVIDDLSVRPVERADSAIRADIVARFREGPPALRGLEVGVSGGVATLRGTLHGWSETQDAELLASEVRGVRAVRNELALDYESSRPDDAIRGDVVASLGNDVYLEGLPIEVAVRDGRVTLTGSVGNAYQRDRATEAAWVANVTDVQNQLEVKWPEEHGVRASAPHPDDEQISKAVKLALSQDLQLADPFAIDVETGSGEVSLKGTVATYEQKLRAANDARDVVGVAWVRNRLEVGKGSMSDAEIRGAVLARFDQDYVLSDRDVDAQVHDGVVTLSGNTWDEGERNHALEVAARVPGVVDVVDQIRVENHPRVGDEELATRIEDRLHQNAETRWVAERVDVVVEDGVAELTGEVFSWGERREAGQVAAHTNGVRGVDNRITVAGIDYPWEDGYGRGEGRFDSYVMSPR